MGSPAIHRKTDERECHGAITGTVMLQTTVFANDLLVAVNGDVNTHGAGELIAGCNDVFVEGMLVVNVGDDANSDSLYNQQGHQSHPHGNPKAMTGSPDIFVGD